MALRATNPEIDAAPARPGASDLRSPGLQKTYLGSEDLSPAFSGAAQRKSEPKKDPKILQNEANKCFKIRATDSKRAENEAKKARF